MSIKKLKEYAKSINIASEFDQEFLDKIGQQVLAGFREDFNSNEEWLSDVKRVEELASLKSVKKSYPLPNSANVKLPIITKACYEFAARTGPEIIRDGEVVKAAIVGDDKNGFKEKLGERVCSFMNYDTIKKSNKWSQQLRNLLQRVALIGFICKKTYYDCVKKEIKSILCKPEELIINSNSESLEDAPRITHILHWRINTFVEQMNTTEGDVSVLLEEPVKELIERFKKDNLDKNIDVLEQCTYLDLDEDDYKEPYIVTCLKDTGKVIRIVASYDEDDIMGKNDKVSYICNYVPYEDYHFLPNPKGCFQSVGFGILLLHLTDTMNSVTNQLLDSGQLANMKGGYMDARLKDLSGGESYHDPGEFKLVKVLSGMALKDGILPLDYGEPSRVLFELLEMLMNVSRDLTSSAEINNGTQSSANAKTGATLAIQQSGEKIFNSINESIYSSLGKEFQHRFSLYSKYLTQDDYTKIVEDPLANVKKDFDEDKISIIPVADPALASATKRLQEASTIQQLMALPGVDPIEATKLIIARIAIPGINKLIPAANAKTPPNPAVLELQLKGQELQQKMAAEGAKIKQKDKELLIQAHLAEAQMVQYRANALALIAKAQSEPIKTQLQAYSAQLDAISKKIDAELGLIQMGHEADMQAMDQQGDLQSQMMDQQHQQNMQQSDQQHQQDMQDQQLDTSSSQDQQNSDNEDQNR